MTFEETRTIFNECDAACNELKAFIDAHAMSLTDRELKKVCDALESLAKRRAAAKSRLNYFGR